MEICGGYWEATGRLLGGYWEAIGRLLRTTPQDVPGRPRTRQNAPGRLLWPLGGCKDRSEAKPQKTVLWSGSWSWSYCHYYHYHHHHHHHHHHYYYYYYMYSHMCTSPSMPSCVVWLHAGPLGPQWTPKDPQNTKLVHFAFDWPQEVPI